MSEELTPQAETTEEEPVKAEAPEETPAPGKWQQIKDRCRVCAKRLKRFYHDHKKEITLVGKLLLTGGLAGAGIALLTRDQNEDSEEEIVPFLEAPPEKPANAISAIAYRFISAEEPCYPEPVEEIRYPSVTETRYDDPSAGMERPPRKPPHEHDRDGHIRTLRKGLPSEEKRREAERQGIRLEENQTFVRKTVVNKGAE